MGSEMCIRDRYIDIELMDQEAQKGIWSDFAEEGLAEEMEAK